MQWDAVTVDLITESLNASSRERRNAALLLANAIRGQRDEKAALDHVESQASPEIVAEARKLRSELGI